MATSPSLLKTPGLSALLGARGLSSLGIQMQAVILGWQMYALTHSAWSLGLIGLAQFAPFLALVFIAGTVVDRADRRRIAAICQAAEAAAALSLAVISLLDAPTPAMLYTLAAVVGTARAFEAPSLQALLPSMVPASPLSARRRPVGPRSSNAPASPGLRWAACSTAPASGVAYGTCACVFALAATCSTRLPARVRVIAQKPPTLASFFEGVGFVARRPDVLGAISLDLFAVLLGGATALLPLFAGGILHAGPIGLGLLRAAPRCRCPPRLARIVPPPARAPSRPGDVLRRRRLRRRHHRLRPVHFPCPSLWPAWRCSAGRTWSASSSAPRWCRCAPPMTCAAASPR